MTLDELKELIADGESDRLEFKETTGQRGEACRTLCAFLNGDGGAVVFGVSRKGKLTGQLVSDAPMEVIMNPDHRSHPRNRLIAQIFFDMGIIEQYGSGIDRIKRECIKNGSPFPEWKEAEGGFLTTYQIRDKKVEVLTNGENQRKSSGVNERAGKMSGVALKAALKTALKTALKDDNDEIVARMLAVYKEIASNTAISLSAVAEKVGLSARTVDEYVGIMKSANVLRRKGGRKFGEWEILTVDSLDGAHA